MNYTNAVITVVVSVTFTIFALILIQPTKSVNNVRWHTYQTDFVPEYTSIYGEIEPDDIQCPIPMTDRVKNYTGIQCVYSSIEMLGRWAEESKLINPPITSRPDCKSYSGPRQAGAILNRLGVRFEQSYSNRQQGLNLIKKAMIEGRGALFGVPGHAMVLVHYSEQENKVCWVDNSDRSLKVQTMTVAEFNSKWDSWVLVVYADNDIVPYKLGSASRLPIIDRIRQQGQYPKDFIPMPGKN